MVLEDVRVVSGMRPTGPLHLGHYHGALKNWLKLQHEYQCYFFVADVHALTTHYEDSAQIEQNSWNMMIEWLAVGINPSNACLFIQSMVPEHAELSTLLSMITPLSWLERVPTYKDQQEKLKERDLSTFGFLGYPLMQAADVLLYKASKIPVGEDQVPHIEFAREVARRFNYLYGRDEDYEKKAENAIEKLGKKGATLYRSLLKRYQEQGDKEALLTGHAFVSEQGNLSMSDRERLEGYLEGIGKVILPEPEALLTPTSKLPGLDGHKMSKSYNNSIYLRDSEAVVEEKILKMQTDPNRKRRSDVGDPDKCPVWGLHDVYSSAESKAWVQQGCRSAGIGCVDCKRNLIESVNAELDPIRDRIAELTENSSMVRGIVMQGCERAREMARDTMNEVKIAMRLPVL